MLDTMPMLSDDPWGVWRYGTEPIVQTGGRVHIPHVASTAHPTAPVWSPNHPLFWFAALLIATGAGMFGISGSGTVKVGKARVAGSGSVGDG